MAGCTGKPASLRVSGCRLLKLTRREGLIARVLAGEDVWSDLLASH